MSEPELPKVSIVLCTRNRARGLEAALQALSEMECSTPWEALIIDNASTDDTAAVIATIAARDPRLVPIHISTIGLGPARDAAWRLARGEIIAFTDDDCYVAKDFVDRIVEVFTSYPDVGCVGGRILLHDPNDAPVTIDVRDYNVNYPAYSFLQAGVLHGANLSFRRVALEQGGGFDWRLGAGTSFKAGEDTAAVAGAMWCGFHARYDPGPTVSHHHGRKQEDVPKLRKGYDVGRGAYYAKFLLRSDSRRVYLAGWWRVTGLYRRPQDWPSLFRETQAAFSYARETMGFRTLLPLLAIAPAFLAYRSATIGVGGLRYVVARAIGRLSKQLAQKG